MITVTLPEWVGYLVAFYFVLLSINAVLSLVNLWLNHRKRKHMDEYIKEGRRLREKKHETHE